MFSASLKVTNLSGRKRFRPFSVATHILASLSSKRSVTWSLVSPTAFAKCATTISFRVRKTPLFAVPNQMPPVRSRRQVVISALSLARATASRSRRLGRVPVDLGSLDTCVLLQSLLAFAWFVLSDRTSSVFAERTYWEVPEDTSSLSDVKREIEFTGDFTDFVEAAPLPNFTTNPEAVPAKIYPSGVVANARICPSGLKPKRESDRGLN